jgi:flagellar protein FliJ
MASSFKFPLQRILDLKAKREEEVARKLANARAEADATRQARDSLAAAHEDGRSQLTGTGASRTVGEMQTLTLMLSHLEQHIVAADLETAAADAAVAKVHVELTSALQERRVLDKLRARQLEAHQQAATLKDQQHMDAIALSRFTNRTGNGDDDSERTS